MAEKDGGVKKEIGRVRHCFFTLRFEPRLCRQEQLSTVFFIFLDGLFPQVGRELEYLPHGATNIRIVGVEGLSKKSHLLSQFRKTIQVFLELPHMARGKSNSSVFLDIFLRCCGWGGGF